MTDGRKDDLLPDETLDRLFAEAREWEPGLTDRLCSRIHADADRQTELRATRELAAMRRRRTAPGGRAGILRQLFRGIGGVPGIAGLAMVMIVSFFVGLTPPAAVASSMASVLGTTAPSQLFDLYYNDSGTVFDFADTEG